MEIRLIRGVSCLNFSWWLAKVAWNLLQPSTSKHDSFDFEKRIVPAAAASLYIGACAVSISTVRVSNCSPVALPEVVIPPGDVERNICNCATSRIPQVPQVYRSI